MSNSNEQLNFDPVYMAQLYQHTQSKTESSKSSSFRAELEQFKAISTIDDARELMKKILPEAKEQRRFVKNGYECTVVDKDDVLRISIDSAKEFISYEFV